jgi:hypothetical protein
VKDNLNRVFVHILKEVLCAHALTPITASATPKAISQPKRLI